jgi:hypothetical protein
MQHQISWRQIIRSETGLSSDWSKLYAKAISSISSTS